MNAHIANLILQRIVDADLPWLDKYAGLTRTVERKDGTVNVRVPVSCGVEDPLHCGTDTLLELSKATQCHADRIRAGWACATYRAFGLWCG